LIVDIRGDCTDVGYPIRRLLGSTADHTLDTRGTMLKKLMVAAAAAAAMALTGLVSAVTAPPCDVPTTSPTCDFSATALANVHVQPSDNHTP
jgi:hypothetical protein